LAPRTGLEPVTLRLHKPTSFLVAWTISSPTLRWSWALDGVLT